MGDARQSRARVRPIVQEKQVHLPTSNKGKSAKGPDGVKVSQVVGRFRADFRLSLMMVAVRRAAAMLLGSGLPGCCVREDVAAIGESVDF